MRARNDFRDSSRRPTAKSSVGAQWFFGALALAGMATAARAAIAPPPELADMRASFAAAVAANDIKAAEALTVFPIGNSAYAAPPKISLAAFPAQFKVYRQIKDCIAREPLTPAAADHPGLKDWELFCDGNVLNFSLRNGKWRHTAYENVNE